MGKLVYLIEGPRAIDRDRVIAAGLGYMLDRKGVAHCGGRTSTGHEGVLICKSGSGRPGPMPKWERHPDLERVHIGWNPDDPPGEAYFRRSRMWDGHPVELANGEQWTVPVARKADGSTPFPCPLKWTGQRWVVSDVPADEVQRKLFNAAIDYWRRGVLAEGKDEDDGDVPIKITWTNAEEWDLGSMSLGLNYRVTRAELSVLGLLTEDTPARVCMALVDWPSVKELLRQHKGCLPNSEGPRPSPGPEESVLVMNRA